MYLSKLLNVSIQIIKCICQNCKMYLSKVQNLFVQIAKYICPNCQMYLDVVQKSAEDAAGAIASLPGPDHLSYIQQDITSKLVFWEPAKPKWGQKFAWHQIGGLPGQDQFSYIWQDVTSQLIFWEVLGPTKPSCGWSVANLIDSLNF